MPTTNNHGSRILAGVLLAGIYIPVTCSSFCALLSHSIYIYILYLTCRSPSKQNKTGLLSIYSTHKCTKMILALIRHTIKGYRKRWSITDHIDRNGIICKRQIHCIFKKSIYDLVCMTKQDFIYHMWFNWSAWLSSCSNWSNCTVKSDSGPGPPYEHHPNT